MRRWIYVIDRTGGHIAPVRDPDSLYQNPQLYAEKSIYDYGIEYVVIVRATDRQQAIDLGHEAMRLYFPEALD